MSAPAAPFSPGLGARSGRKRAFDLLVCLALLPLCLPLILVLAGLIAATGGPVFYGQWRVGQGGRGFRMWKFRSMAPGAAVALAPLLAADPMLARAWARAAKLPGDPRVTRLGRVLRRYGLDELPQFWNVLRGEMSLVGPRPVPREELLRRYGPAVPAYCAGRPGMTGLWQVSQRNSLSYAARARLDLRYRQHGGLCCDLWILMQTVAVVLRGAGDGNFPFDPPGRWGKLAAWRGAGPTAGEGQNAKTGNRPARCGGADPAPVRRRSRLVQRDL